MELTFNKVGNKYEAEFEIQTDANLHIEFENATPIKLYQRTTGSGWDLVNDVKNAVGKATDVDLVALVYPKFIKISCATQPIMGEVTFSSNISTKPEEDNENNEENDLSKEPADVRFFDYDGTLLYSYSYEEACALTELPPLPKHEELEVREWNYTLEDIKAQGTKTIIGKADIGACCYNTNGEQVMTNGTYIIERGITSIDSSTLHPNYNFKMAKVMSVPATVTYVDDSAFGYFTIEHLRMPINAEYRFYYGTAFSPIVIHSIWINGCDLNTNIIDSIRGMNILHIPHTFGIMSTNSLFEDSCIVYVPETIHTINNLATSSKTVFVIFDNHTFVPTLTSFSTYYGTIIFIVPDFLYDEWVNATNWSSISESGSSPWRIKKLSEYSYLIK